MTKAQRLLKANTAREKVIYEWIVALESGRYSQGIGALRNGEIYTAIGVFCDVLDSSRWKTINSRIHHWNGGVTEPGKLAVDVLGSPLLIKVQYMNDVDVKTFEQIAFWLREKFHVVMSDLSDYGTKG